jgi:S-methylmethionine-dependent homocysteine/selenocysteine methylase
MSRPPLPQLAGDFFVTDGGMETVLIFERGLELPHFAAFVLLDDAAGIEELRAYYDPYVDLAREQEVGIILDTPTWRANADWGILLGYSPEELDDVDRRGVRLLFELREDAGEDPPVVISGCIGPRGDGYRVDAAMSPAEAKEYHARQIATFADTPADLVTALTLTYADEAIGIVAAAAEADIPAVISFTLETDGRLPDGTPLGEAIEAVDEATGASAAYFMVNCAHPTHFEAALEGPWLQRLRGLRPNASSKSHAELDEATELDAGDPGELAAQCGALRARVPSINVIGGCCGTDARHIRAIAAGPA